MLRQEAIALLKELGDRGLIQPIFVIIEKQTRDKFQLKIKGSYDINQIEFLLRNRGVTYEKSKDYLIIFKR
jgi:hypothetical protein